MADWAVRNGPALKVKQIIWYGRSYDFRHTNPAWRPYCHGTVLEQAPSQCTNPQPGPYATLQHMDHVHISVF